MMHLDKNALSSDGIAITDCSSRQYHYKNQFLEWCMRFEFRRTGDYEIEKVIVSLVMAERASAVIDVSMVAEIFQLMQAPRWCKSVQTSIGVEALAREGMANLVLRQISEGRALIQPEA